jgi:hypothetical protein
MTKESRSCLLYSPPLALYLALESDLGVWSRGTLNSDLGVVRVGLGPVVGNESGDWMYGLDG